MNSQGSARVWELNTYELSWSWIKYLSEAFIEIVGKYETAVK